MLLQSASKATLEHMAGAIGGATQGASAADNHPQLQTVKVR
jgi:hypothetical protein